MRRQEYSIYVHMHIKEVFYIPHRKKRYARRLNESRCLKPTNTDNSDGSNVLDLDEFEAIRLVDYEGLSQIEAASDMQVSRATIQRLLERARKKITEALLLNRAIEVKNDIKDIKLKGENKMSKETKTKTLIAFPTSDRTTVDGHFGHTKEFAIYTIEENNITDIKFVTPPPHEPGVLPRFLGQLGIDVIITGGMGRMAVSLFHQQDIDVILGAQGRIDTNLQEYVGGTLESTGTTCNHNHGDHHQCA